MAGNLSDYAEQAMLNWMMTNGAVTRPTQWYIGLMSSATDDASAGAEIGGTGYARQAAAFVGAATGGNSYTYNSGAITFTAGAAWGTATDIVIFDAPSGGNRLWHGPLNAARTFQTAGDSLTIAAGSLTLSLD